MWHRPESGPESVTERIIHHHVPRSINFLPQQTAGANRVLFSGNGHYLDSLLTCTAAQPMLRQGDEA